MDRHLAALVAHQNGLVTRSQLAMSGASQAHVRAQLKARRWAPVSATVIATFTGEMLPEQRVWAAVLHAGGGALVGGLTAAALAGLRGWDRPEISVLVPYAEDVPRPMSGVDFIRTRRDTAQLRARGRGLPRCQIEPAVLMFAARSRSTRTAEGVIAATVQQRLSDAATMTKWLERLSPLRRSPVLRRALADIAGGAQSVAELDIRRLCKRHGLAPPRQQVRRRDSGGRTRFTDCEWLLPDGRVLVLEVDGSFHMSVEHWEDDLARQRALSALERIIVRCTAHEVREDGDRLARDLLRLGVPPAA